VLQLLPATMEWITVLFFIGFIGHETWGGNNDPAPGRSPGPPPSITTARYSSDIYSMESNSHEAYRPSEIFQENQQERVASDNKEHFSDDLYSSMSHETEQLHSEYSDSGGDTERSQKLLKIDNPNDVTLNTLKNFSSSSSEISSLSHADTDTNSKENSKSSESDSTTRSHNILCNGMQTRAKISRYLRLGDKIVQIRTNYAKSSEEEVTSGKGAERKFRIDVTHDVFDASESLVAGITYKGKSLISISIYCLYCGFFSSSSFYCCS
jgi:hypothetical protein